MISHVCIRLSGFFTTDIGVTSSMQSGATLLAAAVLLHGLSTTLEGVLLALKANNEFKLNLWLLTLV